MVQILDTTLREGEQTPGVYFQLHDKQKIAEMLNAVGIDYIEAGHPYVSSNIKNAIKKIAGMGLDSKICAHARTDKRDIDEALDCGVGLIGIFYCVSKERLNDYKVSSIEEAKDKISEAVSYAKSENPDVLVRYTPEDTVRSCFENVVEASVSAVNAGADIISIADTTGYMVPQTKNDIGDYFLRLKKAIAEKTDNKNPLFATHCHNDRGFALSNSNSALVNGINILDATVYGIGERAGITDLAQILTRVMEYDIEKCAAADGGAIENGVENDSSSKYDLKSLKKLYEFVKKKTGIEVNSNFPIFGKNAFTHCAGVHTNAAMKNPIHYESLSPEVYGREMEVTLDHMSGRSNIEYNLQKIGMQDICKTEMGEILQVVKNRGEMGTIVELEELRCIVESIKR